MTDEYKEASVEGDVKRTIQNIREADVGPFNYKSHYKEFIEAVRIIESIVSEKATEVDESVTPERETEEDNLRAVNAMPSDKLSTHSKLAKKLHAETTALNNLKEWLLLEKELVRLMTNKLFGALEASNATEALSAFTKDSKELIKELADGQEKRYQDLHNSLKLQRDDFKEVLRVITEKSNLKDNIIEELHKNLGSATKQIDELKKLQDTLPLTSAEKKVAGADEDEKEVEGEEIEEEEEEKYSCKQCDFKTNDKEEMLKHIKEAHPDSIKGY